MKIIENLKPIIIAIDDDPFILNAVASVLKEEYYSTRWYDIFP